MQKIQKIGPPGAKDMGSAIHAALEVLFRTGDIAIAEDELNKWSPLSGGCGLGEEDFYKAKGILAGYWKRWGNPRDRYEVKLIEKSFTVPIPDSDYTFDGRIDAVVVDRTTGRCQLWDHKTAGRVDSDYIIRRWMDLQLNLYAIGTAEGLGIQIDEYVYDIMKKPDVRRKKSETVEEYAARCVEVCTPNLYDRVIYPREDMRVEETKRQLMGWLSAMEIAELTGFYGENINRCSDYGGCPYWDACVSGGAQIVLENGYKSKEDRKP